MFLNIRDMEVRPLVFDLSYSPGEIDFLDEGLSQTGDLRVEGRADWLGSVEEVRVRGWIRVDMSGPCERCLEAAPLQVDRKFDLFYRPAGSTPEAGEVALKEGEVEIGFYEGDGLDLTEILREQVLLALPMQRLCRTDCRGLCPVCGADRNRQSCSCVTEIADERWAALRDFAAR
ncbi:MAG: DUF177 domain-containing protein [Bryobacteraceae bacterium]|nr:DUF177 domain-containing protein [Bryobacteraceae bacterium]